MLFVLAVFEEAEPELVPVDDFIDPPPPPEKAVEMSTELKPLVDFRSEFLSFFVALGFTSVSSSLVDDDDGDDDDADNDDCGFGSVIFTATFLAAGTGAFFISGLGGHEQGVVAVIHRAGNLAETLSRHDNILVHERIDDGQIHVILCALNLDGIEGKLRRY